MGAIASVKLPETGDESEVGHATCRPAETDAPGSMPEVTWKIEPVARVGHSALGRKMWNPRV